MTYDALGFDPAPGEVARGREMTRRLRSATQALAEMDRVVRGTGSDAWEGKAAHAFYGLVESDLRPRVSEAYQSFDAATRALERWVEGLGGYQARARALEVEAEQARADLTAAQAAYDGIGDPPTGDIDPADRREYDDKKTRHEGAVERHQGALDSIVRRARALADEATASATTAAGALETAAKVAPDEPGLWDKISDVFEDIGEFLTDVVEYVRDNWWDLLHRLVSITASVLAIASLFCPALAPFALGFAIADVAMSGIDWMRGVPGAKEAFLTGVIGLAGGAVVGKVVGAFTNAAGPVLAAGPFRVVSSGGAASVAAPAAAVLSYNPGFGPALGGMMIVKMKDAKDTSDTVMGLLGGGPSYYGGKLASGWREARSS